MNAGKRAMPVQVLADNLLAETGRPLDTRAIAEELLRRQLVTSSASSPWYSIATTLEKNIREGRYNEPKLAFVLDERGRPLYGARGRRLIQRAGWALANGATTEAQTTARRPRAISSLGSAPRRQAAAEPEATMLVIRVSSELLGHIQLAQLAGFGGNQEESALALLQRGIVASAAEVGLRIKERFNL